MEGFSDAKNTIDNKKEKEKPSVLLRRAINALEQVNADTISKAKDKASILAQLEDIFNHYKSLKDAVK